MEDDYGRQLVSAAARHETLFADRDVAAAIMDYLYGVNQESVAIAVLALREGARNMLGSTALGVDLFGESGDAAVGNAWDVLQNYAQEAFFRDRQQRAMDEGVISDLYSERQYPWKLVAASYDPAMRRALGEWADQNADLLQDDEAAVGVFASLASGDLNGYAREFAATPEADVLLSAGRLPFAPNLVLRSPELARLAAGIWRVASADSPTHRELSKQTGGPAMAA